MHVLQLSQRNGQAQERLVRAAKAFARVANLDPALIEALTPGTKDLAVRAMQEREAVADLLEALAISAHIPLTEPAAEEPAVDDVTTVTTPEQEAVSLPEAGQDAPAESGEELPPPVLEDGENPRAVGGLVDPSKIYLINEEEPAAEEPAAEDKPKGAKKRTSKK